LCEENTLFSDSMSTPSTDLIAWPDPLPEKTFTVSWLRLGMVLALIAASFPFCAYIPLPLPASTPEWAQAALATVPWSCCIAAAIYLLRDLAHVAPRRVIACAVVLAVLAVVTLSLDQSVMLDGPPRAVLAILLGAALAILIDQFFFLLPAAILAALVDIWSVYSQHGVTRKLIESSDGFGGASTEAVPAGNGGAVVSDGAGNAAQVAADQGTSLAARVADIVATPVPLWGTSETAALGFVDIAFAACFLIVAYSVRSRTRWMAASVAAGIPITMAIAAATDSVLPALPMIGLLAVAMNAGPILRDRRHVARRLQSEPQ
jgi:hypothetical protein